MRSLGGAYNCDAIKSLGQDQLEQYCKHLHYNPLLIKWFVHAVNKGTAPADILSRDVINEALAFCWHNVYGGLTLRAKKTLAILLACRQTVSRTELQELSYKLEDMDFDQFHDTIVELNQANVVEFNIDKDGSEIYQVGSLIREYLMNHHRPSNKVFKDTREQIRQFNIEEEARRSRRNVYRYNRHYVHAESRGQQVAARHSEAALEHINRRNTDAAMKSLSVAGEMEPTWWEVHRLKALLLEANTISL